MFYHQLQDNLTLGQQNVQEDAQVDIRVNFQGKCIFVFIFNCAPPNGQEVIFPNVIFMSWIIPKISKHEAETRLSISSVVTFIVMKVILK